MSKKSREAAESASGAFCEWRGVNVHKEMFCEWRGVEKEISWMADMTDMNVKVWWTEHKQEILLALAVSLVAFGVMLTCPTIGIDEEKSILAGEGYGPWIGQGRFGIQLFNEIFTIDGRYAPFLWDFLAVCVWFFSGVVYAFTLLETGVKRAGHFEVFIFLAYYTTLPFVVGEILSFSMFNFQVSLGMLSAAAAFWFSVRYVEYMEKRDRQAEVKTSAWKYLLLSVLLLTYGISVYQAILSLYITAAVIYCLQRVLSGKLVIWNIVARTMFICVISLACYYGLSMLIQTVTGNPAGYTESYIGWLEDGSIVHAAFMAVANVARVSFGITVEDVSIYGGRVIMINTVLFIVWSVAVFARAGEKGMKSRILFLTVALVLSPFAMFIAMGTYKTQGRMLLALPLAGAMELCFLLRESERLSSVGRRMRGFRYVMTGLAVFLVFLNVRNMNTIYYYDAVRYHQDQVTANAVMHDIAGMGYDYRTKPVVFVGAYRPDTAVLLDSSDNLGIDGSMFGWNGGHIARMREFLVIEGYMTAAPSAEDIADALNYTEGMNPWPGPESIRETDRCIIVYFSEPSEDWYVVNGVNMLQEP